MNNWLEITFRSATVDDADKILELVHSSYRGDASRAGWTTEADILDGQRTDVDGINEIIQKPGSRLLLAFDVETLVGCCQLEDRANRAAYLGLFAVSPQSQGRGLGRAIMSEAQRIARDEFDSEEMRMSVIRQRHDLIAWYERLGFAPNGEVEPFPYDDKRFGIPKQDDLEFVILTKSLS